MKKTINEAARTITWTFENGLPDVTFTAAKASTENQDYAILHGFAARIGDNAAISKSKENGFVVTEAMRRDAIIEMASHYESGSVDWNLKATGTRAVKQDATILAIAAKLGITYEAAQAKIAERFLSELAGEA